MVQIGTSFRKILHPEMAHARPFRFVSSRSISAKNLDVCIPQIGEELLDSNSLNCLWSTDLSHSPETELSRFLPHVRENHQHVAPTCPGLLENPAGRSVTPEVVAVKLY